MIYTADDNNFNEEVLESKIPVLVDFWAPWCAPCKSLGLIIESIAASYADNMKIVKINIEEANQTATLYKIMAVPTVIIFIEGQIVCSKMGGMSKLELISLINNHISE